MEAFDAAVVSPDGRTISFVLSIRDRDVECTVTREALVQHFWLETSADETRMLKAFEGGRNRIVAIAQRRGLARPLNRVTLDADDFRIR
jgi:hypothetical protein